MQTEPIQVKCRIAEVSDSEQVLALWQECGLVGPQSNPSLDFLCKYQFDSQRFLVIQAGDMIIGSIMYGYDGHLGSINYLAVLPQYQKLGIASLLLKEAELQLKKLNCSKINLLIKNSNTGVAEFYQKNNYRVDPVLCMSKKLVRDSKITKDK